MFATELLEAIKFVGVTELNYFSTKSPQFVCTELQGPCIITEVESDFVFGGFVSLAWLVALRRGFKTVSSIMDIFIQA